MEIVIWNFPSVLYVVVLRSTHYIFTEVLAAFFEFAEVLQMNNMLPLHKHLKTTCTVLLKTKHL
jgi:hypothetical protein